MIMKPVVSSSISAIGYDNMSQTLYIRFIKGKTYSYYNVPTNVYEGLNNAKSKGRYYANFIKGRYNG